MPFFKLNDIFARRYQLNELLGKGDSSEVWKAIDHMGEDAVVVLKIYVPERELSEEEVNQLRHEFTCLQNLSHPHLLKAYHFDVWEGAPYLLMPFYSMETLASLLEAEGPVSERQVALVLSQIGAALDTLHQQEPSIIHHDIKPGNIVVSKPDNFLLADFGINAQKSPALPATYAKSGRGTVAYAPPESFDPLQKADASGDVFSLGVTLYQLCTNTIPWNGSGGHKLVNGGNVPNLPGHYSAELNELLKACMSADKSQRPKANELHLTGAYFLETGNWKLQENREEESKLLNWQLMDERNMEGSSEENQSLKSRMQYVLATAVLVFLLVGGYWAYQTYSQAGPDERLQGMDPAANQDVDEMLISTLEDELEDMQRRTRELEEENKQLKRNGSENSILMNNQDQIAENEEAGQPSDENKQPKPAIENQEKATREAKAAEPGNKKTAAPGSVAPAKETNTPLLTSELEKQLNKISGSELSGKARAAWKQETMARFAEGAIQIVDETEGTPRRYSASIFLNLLSKVPHTIEVKEVKTNQNKKVTELRLTMQAKM